VEDDPDVLNIAVSGLLDLGYEVKTAANAQEAMAVLREDTNIDVLFSDVVMPGGMNGAQLAVEARRLALMTRWTWRPPSRAFSTR
jgi:CheY-like chemotaxis protein